MAKNAEAEVSTAGQADTISMREWQKRVCAFLRYGVPSQKALVCEGEAGCGKSEMTAQVCRDLGVEPIIVPGLGAQQQEELLSAVKLVEGEDGQGKLLQGVIDTLMPTEKHAKDPRYQLNGRPCIPWIIDEIWTGNMAQMNQVRAALTFRQIGGAKLPDGVFILGTTNPEDVVYSSRKSVDYAVQDRVETYRVRMHFEDHQDYLSKEEAAGRYPEACRMFLRMEENKDLWNLASARFWHIQFGQTWMELSSDRDIDSSLRMKLFQGSVADHFSGLAKKNKQRHNDKKLPLTAEALVSRFYNYIKHGDDPRWYPISSNRLLNASEAERKQHLELIKYWTDEDQQGFIGVTIQDLTLAMLRTKEVSEEQCKHIANILKITNTALVADFCVRIYRENESVYEDLERAMTESGALDHVSRVVLDNDKMTKDLREEKRRRADKKKASDVAK